MNDADKARCEELCTRYLFSNIHGGETGTIKDNLLNFTHKEKNLKRVLLLLDARHGKKYIICHYVCVLFYQDATLFSCLSSWQLFNL